MATSILNFSKNFDIIYIENKERKYFIMDNCAKCVWAVWYYGSVVECCGGPCPTEEEFEIAERMGCLAIDGIAEDEEGIEL